MTSVRPIEGGDEIPVEFALMRPDVNPPALPPKPNFSDFLAELARLDRAGELS